MIGGWVRVGSAIRSIPRAAFVVAALAHAGLISFLSHVPGDRMPSHGFLMSVFFNLAHAPLFGVLAFLVASSLAQRDAAGRRRLPAGRAALAAASALCFGFFDEWHQSFVSGRSSDPTDLVTDLAGIVFGVLLAHALLEARPPGRASICAAASCVIVAVAAAAVAAS
jgi:VanZ family protein